LLSKTTNIIKSDFLRTSRQGAPVRRDAVEQNFQFSSDGHYFRNIERRISWALLMAMPQCSILRDSIMKLSHFAPARKSPSKHRRSKIQVGAVTSVLDCITAGDIV
jgi:hypothetical protein